MPEYCLQSAEDKTIGTVKEVLDAIVAKFPGSEKEADRLVAVKVGGEHVADVYAHSPDDFDDDAESANVSEAPVTWFNILGDDDMVIYEFLIATYGVEEMEI